jgi:hypothetical protein
MGAPLDVDRFWCQLAWRLYQRSLMVARSLIVTAGPVSAIRRGTVRRRWPEQAGPCRTSASLDLQPRFARRGQTASQRRLQLPQAACRVAVERWRRQDRCGPAVIAVHRGEGDPVIRVDTSICTRPASLPDPAKPCSTCRSGEWRQGTPCACACACACACPFRNGVVL